MKKMKNFKRVNISVSMESFKLLNQMASENFLLLGTYARQILLGHIKNNSINTIKK